MRAREPLVVAFFAVAGGVVAASFIGIGLAEATAAFLGCAVCSLIICCLPSSSPWLRHSVIAASLFFLGTTPVILRPASTKLSLSVPDNTLALFEGCVVEPALIAADRERFTVEFAPGARAQVSL
ncbi:MAG TPA: hypothetical protein VHB50_19150, partial [Bryobacteraceae bacterium]|nr:hypothetical protein [Bryobacteraceae bacterium]